MCYILIACTYVYILHIYYTCKFKNKSLGNSCDLNSASINIIELMDELY